MLSYSFKEFEKRMVVHISEKKNSNKTTLRKLIKKVREIQMNTTNILVIGNGFDLAHGLPTRYMDFLEFIEEYFKYKELGESQEQYFVFFKKVDKQKEYFEINELMNNNLWFYYFHDLKLHRLLEGKDNWIDFEKEISSVVQTLDKTIRLYNQRESNYFSDESMQKYFNKLQYLLKQNQEILPTIKNENSIESLESLKQNLLKDLNRFIRCMEIYFNYVNEYSMHNMESKEFINKLNINKILSFNYTNTFECLYGSHFTDITYDYIHGKADVNHDINSCNLVLGIDEYLDENEKNTNVEFVQFKKFFQRIYKGTGCLYKDWLLENEGEMYIPKINLYFIGHSLDVTDKDILKELILHEGANTTIYYHNQEALSRMITNLVKVIGEDELISRTGGYHGSIKFKQQPE